MKKRDTTTVSYSASMSIIEKNVPLSPVWIKSKNVSLRYLGECRGVSQLTSRNKSIEGG